MRPLIIYLVMFQVRRVSTFLVRQTRSLPCRPLQKPAVVVVVSSSSSSSASLLASGVGWRDTRIFSSQSGGVPSFKPGDKIQVEVISFGPLGASVEVIGDSHDPESLIPEDEPPLATGLILQKEIQYFRQSRDNVDVVRGEVLPAYVEKVRDDGKIDISLRTFGGKAKAEEVSTMILDKLSWAPGGVLQVGDKSSPEEIAKEFPGVSKSSFKRAVGALYKLGKIDPSPHSITLVRKN